MNLGQLLPQVYDSLGWLQVDFATAGSTTEITLGDLPDKGKPDDYVGAAIMVMGTTDGEAPLHQFSRCTVYDGEGVFTVSPALTATITAGDRIGYAGVLYPLYDVIEKINNGLRSLGDKIILVDTSTLTTANNQTEYGCNVEWKRSKPLRIDIQTQTDDANDNQWMMVDNWEYIPAAAGVAGVIKLPQFPAGYALRIWYKGIHPRVTLYSDEINEAIPPELAVLAAAKNAAEWNHKRQTTNKNAAIANFFSTEFDRAMMRHQMPNQQKRQRILTLRSGSGSTYHGEVGKVRQ